MIYLKKSSTFSANCPQASTTTFSPVGAVIGLENKSVKRVPPGDLGSLTVTSPYLVSLPVVNKILLIVSSTGTDGAVDGATDDAVDDALEVFLDDMF